MSVPDLYAPKELHELMLKYLRSKNPSPSNFSSTYSLEEVSGKIEKVTYNTDSFD